MCKSVCVPVYATYRGPLNKIHCPRGDRLSSWGPKASKRGKIKPLITHILGVTWGYSSVHILKSHANNTNTMCASSLSAAPLTPPPFWLNTRAIVFSCIQPEGNYQGDSCIWTPPPTPTPRRLITQGVLVGGKIENARLNPFSEWPPLTLTPNIFDSSRVGFGGNYWRWSQHARNRSISFFHTQLQTLLAWQVINC